VASESAEIANMADHVILVVRAGRTSVRALREAVTTLKLNEINLIGVVLIGALEASDYSYYYSQYRSEREAKGSKVPALGGAGEARR
jgi:Mrp family chromosome partitioning ATPase